MAEASVSAAPGVHPTEKSLKAIWAASIGNLLEWYDFGVYAYLVSVAKWHFSRPRLSFPRRIDKN
jgi:MFS transporter, MHS family, proline/betaine transporter